MSPENYGNTLLYEYFIRRAHKSSRTTKNGADSSVMAILMNIEQGTARKGNLEKQITKIKIYMEKALDKFLKFKLTEAERTAFLHLKKDLERAYSSAVDADRRKWAGTYAALCERLN